MRPASGERLVSTGSSTATGTSPTSSGTVRPWIEARASTLGEHGLFIGLFTLGLALRFLVQFTYWPAMWDPDSHDYFHAAYTFWIDTTRPSGYGFLMHFVPGWTHLWPVAALQHVLALATAVGIYLVLQRWNVPRWASAIATIPMLLDSMQLATEQFLLSDVLAQLLVLNACVLLLWRRKISVSHAIVAGLLLGVASTVRNIAAPLIIVAGVWTVLMARRRWRATVALVLAAATPLGAYVVDYHHQHGVYSTSSFGSHYLYLRVGVFADCNALRLPRYERPLCLRDVPPAARTDSMLLWQPMAPPRHLKPPRGMTVASVLADFDKRVIAQQTRDYAWAVTADTLRAFYPTRRIWLENHFDDQWVFTSKIWYDKVAVESKRLLASGIRPRVNTTGASILSRYPVYVPGPVSALLLMVGVACVLGFRRSRRDYATRVAVGALMAVAVATVVVPAVTAIFCWRYQIIQIALLPVAAALAATSMARGRATGQDPDQPAAVPDEVTAATP